MQAVRTLLLFATASAGCTTLGPMPAMTGTTPIPAPRTGAEIQIAVVPGHYLSSSVEAEPSGSGIPQALALFDTGGQIAPGLILGGRYVGKGDEGGYPEPVVGYRAYFDKAQKFAVAAVAYGTHGSGENDGARYEVTRLGGEIGIDARLSPRNRWVEVHIVAGGAATGMWADGTYCEDTAGEFAVDCDDGAVADREASASGLYPTAHLGLALDAFRHRSSFVHGARLGIDLAAGRMPRVIAGEQVSGESYASLGLSLTVGLGAVGAD